MTGKFKLNYSGFTIRIYSVPGESLRFKFKFQAVNQSCRKWCLSQTVILQFIFDIPFSMTFNPVNLKLQMQHLLTSRGK